MILRRFWERRGDNQPHELDNGTPYWLENLSRPDRAVNDVAEAHDHYENTVQSQSVWAVYHGENQKEQFLDGLLKIEELVLDHLQ